MNRLLIFLLVVLFVLIGLAVAAHQLWGMWGLLGYFVLLVFGMFGLKKLAGIVLKRMFFAPFKAKSVVLADAGLVVHSIVLSTKPARTIDEGDYDEDEDDLMQDEFDEDEFDEDDEDSEDDEDEDDEGPWDWYEIDATITPRPSKGPFQHWEPGELVLVQPHAKTRDDMDDDNTVGHVHSVYIWADGRWASDDSSKYIGPLRLKLHVGVQPGTRRARLRYYFEVFGEELELPAPKTA